MCHVYLKTGEIEGGSKLKKNNCHNVTDETTLLYKRLYEEETETVLEIALNITSATVMHTNVQKLLNDDTEQFDAVIVEWMYSEVYAG